MNAAITWARQGSRWIPLCFVAFFLGLFTVDAVLVTLALRNFSGVAVEGHFEKGLHYNETLDALRAQDALGWDVALQHASLGAGALRLDLALSDAAGQPLRATAVTVDFLRPSHDGYDARHALAEQSAGRYALETELPLLGLWDAQITVERDGARHISKHRLMLR